MMLELYVGQSFQTWLDAEKFLTDYSLKKGLVLDEKEQNH